MYTRYKDSTIVRARDLIQPPVLTLPPITVRTLVPLYRSPNGVRLVADIPFWPVKARRVVVTAWWNSSAWAFRGYALRQRAYVITQSSRLFAAGELHPHEEGITWAWGWEGRAARALAAAAALGAGL